MMTNKQTKNWFQFYCWLSLSYYHWVWIDFPIYFLRISGYNRMKMENIFLCFISISIFFIVLFVYLWLDWISVLCILVLRLFVERGQYYMHTVYIYMHKTKRIGVGISSLWQGDAFRIYCISVDKWFCNRFARLLTLVPFYIWFIKTEFLVYLATKLTYWFCIQPGVHNMTMLKKKTISAQQVIYAEFHFFCSVCKLIVLNLKKCKNFCKYIPS